MEEYAAKVYDKYSNAGSKGGGGMKDRTKKYARRAAGWLLIILLFVIIVPVGAVMFVISGLWSALDRALLKWNR